MRASENRRKGFTLIELLLVMVILGLLAGTG
jgi:prepilin-type N-terminal cleavage/methylation domain-containing protein